MGGGDRKGTKASSAKAAEALTARSGGASGFGGFSGSTSLGAQAPGFGFGASSVASAAACTAAFAAASGFSSSNGSATAAALTAVTSSEQECGLGMDSEIAQHMRHLAKKDSVTRHKALQALRAVIKERVSRGTSQSDLAVAILPWIYQYKRGLYCDNSRAVRTEAAALTGELVGAVGKHAGPHIKALMGSWWAAQFDSHTEAAAAARAGLQACLPGEKQMAAVLYCHQELMDQLLTNMMMTKEQLGDPKKETVEELEDRHERVVSMSVLAVSSLLDITSPAPEPAVPQASSSGLISATPSATTSVATAASFIVTQVLELLGKPNLFSKGIVKSKSRVVRGAGYVLLKTLAVRQPALLMEQVSVLSVAGSNAYEEAVVAVLGAFQEQEASIHGSMWEMVLTFLKAYPSAWSHTHVRKVFLPRLRAFLKSACYGSASSSFPALLPLLTLMPSTMLGPEPDVPLLLLEAVWEGLNFELQQQGGAVGLAAARLGRQAALPSAAEAYLECLTWLLGQSEKVELLPTLSEKVELLPTLSETAPATELPVVMYCSSLLAGSLGKHVLPLVLPSTENPPRKHSPQLREVATKILTGCITKVLTSSSLPITKENAAGPVLVSSIEQAASSLQPGQAALMSHLELAFTEAAELITCSSTSGQLPGIVADHAVDAPASAASASRAEAAAQQLEAMMTRLRELSSNSQPSLTQALTLRLATGISARLMQSLSGPACDNSPIASHLLASLARLSGANMSILLQGSDMTGVASAGLDGLVQLYLKGPLKGPAAVAHADLLAAYLFQQQQQSQEAVEMWEGVLKIVTSGPKRPSSQGPPSTSPCTSCSTDVPSISTDSTTPIMFESEAEGYWKVALLLCQYLSLMTSSSSAISSTGLHSSSARSMFLSVFGGSIPYLGELACHLSASALSFSQEDTEFSAASAQLLSVLMGGNLVGLSWIREGDLRQVLTNLGACLADKGTRGAVVFCLRVLTLLRGVRGVEEGSMKDIIGKVLSSCEEGCDLMLRVADMAWMVVGAVGGQTGSFQRVLAKGLEDSRDEEEDKGDEEEIEEIEEEEIEDEVEDAAKSGHQHRDGEETSVEVLSVVEEEDEEEDGDVHSGGGAIGTVVSGLVVDLWRSGALLQSVFEAEGTAAAPSHISVPFSTARATPPELTSIKLQAVNILVKRLMDELTQVLEERSAGSSLRKITRHVSEVVAALLNSHQEAAAQKLLGCVLCFNSPSQHEENWTERSIICDVGDSSQPAGLKYAPPPWCLIAQGAKGKLGEPPSISSHHLENDRLGSNRLRSSMMLVAEGIVETLGFDVLFNIMGVQGNRGHRMGDTGDMSNNEVSFPQDTGGRAWLAVELLCSKDNSSAQRHDVATTSVSCRMEFMKQLSTVLPSRSPKFVLEVLEGLFVAANAVAVAHSNHHEGEPCTSKTTSGTTSSVVDPLEVLLGLLKHLYVKVPPGSSSSSSRGRKAVLLSFFKRALVPCKMLEGGPAAGASSPTSGRLCLPVFTKVVSAVTLALRCRSYDCEGSDVRSVIEKEEREAMHREMEEEDSLSALSIRWCEYSLGLPPVSVEAEKHAMEILQVAVAAFPLPTIQAGMQRPECASNAGFVILDEEKHALVALLRHQAVRHAGVAASRRADPSTSISKATGFNAKPYLDIEVCCLVSELEASAAWYCPDFLGQAEWAAVLHDAQGLADVTQSMLTGVTHELCAAVCTAAAEVLSTTAVSETVQACPMTGAMALQLLRRLGDKGLLESHLVSEHLGAAFKEVLSLPSCFRLAHCSDFATALSSTSEPVPDECQQVMSELPTQSARLSGILLALYASTSSGLSVASGSESPQCNALVSDFSAAMTECAEMVIRNALSIGAARCFVEVGGGQGRVAFTAWSAASAVSDFVLEVAAACGHLQRAPGLTADALSAAAEATDAKMLASGFGVDSIDCALALALDMRPHFPLSSPAVLLLLDSRVMLPRLTFPPTHVDGEDAEAPDYDGSDPAGYLSKAGLRSLLARALVSGPGLSHSLSSTRQRVFLTSWALLLSHLQALPADSEIGTVLGQALREASELPAALLNCLVQLLPLKQLGRKLGSSCDEASRKFPARSGGATEQLSCSVLDGDLASALRSHFRNLVVSSSPFSAVRTEVAKLMYGAVLRSLPASARTWFGDLRDRGTAAQVEQYTSAVESPLLLSAEMRQIQEHGQRYSTDTFTVRANPSNREVVAVLQVEDAASLEVSVRLSPCSPLRAAEVECRRKVGVSDNKLRKWLLSMSAFMRNQNRGVVDAIELWKRNVDKEFEGVEPCLICYSIVSATNSQLPRLQCRTCNVRFHPACLYKWFKSSGKSACVHCQAPW
ncbi:hypothetical protein CEUSTIGMA_g6627.t1 [Chlamydomonas eustigma]|uniref:E3 ubiquitin-protein ligase listerin n=1 Tax=Chlamydomonas eustigma TaxID=1157962 RepID=A0A250X801_9CHLO|nr:hypothetical protein CEUSTIGMA_g6627.t1 [Chlamydomonas eustigma]|eukprot:GAX79187.1 hypothetical protein CEUSTIGMA_g6627.t1 [Chlamydomonas eustigma]